MANKTITMLQIRRVLQLLQAGFSNRMLSKELGISRNTVQTYIDKIKKSGKNFSELLSLNDFELSQSLHGNKEGIKNDERYHDLFDRFPVYAEELKKRGVTRLLLWNEYVNETGSGYSYSRFCEHFSGYLLSTRSVMHFEHTPGLVMQADFAGDNLHYINNQTGEIIECPVLVCVLPYSHYMYIEALISAKQEHLFAALGRCLEYFGGVAKSIKSDNMKQYVSKANRYEPCFTEVAEQWSLHYNTSLTAARVKKPRDKASVEKGVDLAYKKIYAPLRNEELYSLEELNQRVLQLLDRHNRMQMQNRPFSRYERFIQEEKPTLTPLPKDPFVIKHVATAKVQKNYHVTLGEDWHHYSVPYQYIGRQVRLVYDTVEVEIYNGLQRIAIHKRNYKKHSYTTMGEHMPPSHQHYKEARGWDGEYFLAKANEIGEGVEQVIKKVLDSKIFTEQTYNSCLGIFRLGQRYGNDRLEAACKRTFQIRAVNYKVIKNILEKNLDKQIYIEFNDEVKIPEHDNLRGSQVYN